MYLAFGRKLRVPDESQNRVLDGKKRRDHAKLDANNHKRADPGALSRVSGVGAATGDNAAPGVHNRPDRQQDRQRVEHLQRNLSDDLSLLGVAPFFNQLCNPEAADAVGDANGCHEEQVQEHADELQRRDEAKTHDVDEHKEEGEADNRLSHFRVEVGAGGFEVLGGVDDLRPHKAHVQRGDGPKARRAGDEDGVVKQVPVVEVLRGRGDDVVEEP